MDDLLSTHFENMNHQKEVKEKVDYDNYDWQKVPWRSWGSWYSWGSPTGLTLGYAIFLLSTVVALVLLRQNGLI
jgi:hypothetical protein